MAVSEPVTATVTVTPASALKSFFELWIGTDSGPLPVMPAYDAAWNGRPLLVGPYRVWFDATGKPRYKSGAPLSDTDGVLLGSGTGGGGAQLLVIDAGTPVPSDTPDGTVIFEEA